MNAWLLFSFFAIRISKINHKALRMKRSREKMRGREFGFSTAIKPNHSQNQSPGLYLIFTDTNKSIKAHLSLSLTLTQIHTVYDSLLNVFELLYVLYFDIVRVVSQQVDGVRNHVLRQEGDQLFYKKRTLELIIVSHVNMESEFYLRMGIFCLFDSGHSHWKTPSVQRNERHVLYRHAEINSAWRNEGPKHLPRK